MTAIMNIAPAISEPLTWAEIQARYPNQWVCLVEMDRAKLCDPVIRSARVVGHGTSRESFEQAMPWRDHYEMIGHYFTGRITGNHRFRMQVTYYDDET